MKSICSSTYNVIGGCMYAVYRYFFLRLYYNFIVVMISRNVRIWGAHTPYQLSSQREMEYVVVFSSFCIFFSTRHLFDFFLSFLLPLPGKLEQRASFIVKNVGAYITHLLTRHNAKCYKNESLV